MCEEKWVKKCGMILSVFFPGYPSTNMALDRLVRVELGQPPAALGSLDAPKSKRWVYGHAFFEPLWWSMSQMKVNPHDTRGTSFVELSIDF